MEAYEGIMNSTRAPFSILPKPIDEDGNTPLCSDDVDSVTEFQLARVATRTALHSPQAHQFALSEGDVLP